MEFKPDYEYEKAYWGTCANTFYEDHKHYVYGPLMGLQQEWVYFKLPNITVLDIGGGPSSLLLKCWGLNKGKVVDPIDYPQWTKDRYKLVNIDIDLKLGEDIDETGWDEVWIYNCMQHAIDPEKIINNAKKAAPVLRIFEWIDIPAHEGHPWMLTEAELNKWIGKRGEVCELNGSRGCYGKAYYGKFTH